jgi:hypothetical protein
LKLIKATDLIPVENPTIVIVSDPGVGKTTLGYGADRALLLDYDLGAHRAKNRRETLQPDNWKDAETVLDKPEILKEAFGKSLDDFGTFVVDTTGRALDLLAAELIQSNPKAGRDGGLSIQGWGMLKSRFTTFKNRLAHQKKGLVLLCHGKEEKDGDNKIVRPDIQGGSLGEVLKSADVLGYLHFDGKRRVIDWNPSDRWIAKSPGWGQMDVPDYQAEPNFLAKIQAKAREDLGKMSGDSAKAAAQVVELLAAINQTEDLSELNTMLSNKDAIPVVVRAQIRPALVSRAKALGGVADKASGLYVKQQEAVA